MFGISMYELGLIVLIGLIFLGPRQLTETARVVGRMIRELQKMATDVQRSINLELDEPVSTRPPTYSHKPEPKDLQPTSETTDTNDKELKLPLGEKAGPDFYAELLASSSEPEPPAPTDEKPIDDSPEQDKPKPAISS